MGNKYKILYDQKEEIYDNIFAYRIQALKDFDDVKSGDIGGFVQSEKNLSQEGNCWIYDNASAINDSIILDNAKIKDKAYIADNAIIYGNAIVLDEPYIIGRANVFENAKISGSTYIDDDALIHGNSIIRECAEVGGKSNICGNSIIEGFARVYNSDIEGYEYFDKDSNEYFPGKVHIFEHTFVFDSYVRGYDIEITRDIQNADIGANAKISSFVDGAKIGYNGFIVDYHMYWDLNVIHTPFSGTVYVGIDGKLYYERGLIDDVLKDYEEELNSGFYDRELTEQSLNLIKSIHAKGIRNGEIL